MRTYGRLKWADGWWLLELEPHVLLRAKRVFPQADSESIGELRIYDTPATSRDIEWFIERFPVDVVDRARLEQRARKHDAAMAAVQGVLQRTSPIPDFELAVPARAYQRQAADLLLKTGRLLLADDVGLGKTASAIAAMTREVARPVCVVTLTHLPEQWRDELKKFAPKLDIFIPKRGTPTERDLEQLKGLIAPDVVILNYHKLEGWVDVLVQVLGIKLVVYDECQELRTGGGTGKYRGAQRIERCTPFKVGLSATPVYNYGGEIFNVIDALEHGALGTREEFLREWCNERDKKARVRDPKALGAFLREQGLMLRRTWADVLSEVPAPEEPIKIPHLIDADVGIINEAQTQAAELARVILGRGRLGFDKMQAASELDMRLRQATGIAKAPYVSAFVRMLLESERNVVLYGWHHAVYELWREALREFHPVFFTGRETAAEKLRAKSWFIDGSSRVLIMSLRAGAGLDGLQRVCRTCVFGELDWSPGVHDQCIGRLGRPEQNDVVRAYFLHAESGSDPVLVDVLGIKQAQQRGIRDPKAEVLERVGNTAEHIRALAEACLRAVEARQRRRTSEVVASAP